MAEDFRIELTGNPFVDHGLAVIAHLADLDEIADLHYRHLVQVHGDGSRLARRNALTKAFSMIFTANSLLIHPSTKRSEKQQQRYRRNYLAILKALLDTIPASKKGVHLCEACGRYEAVNFPKLTLEALKVVDDDAEAKEIGRDWFPLVGSISEVQALPGGGRSYRFCPLCLFAVHYLSLSMQLMDGKLVCLQSNHSEFWYQLIRNSTSEMINRLDAGLPDIPGGGQGNLYFLVNLINLFEKLQGEKLHTELPYDVSLILWLWSNSGQGASCDWIRVPHISLRFLWQVVGEGFKPALTNLLAGTDNRGTRSFFHCLSSGEDYH